MRKQWLFLIVVLLTSLTLWGCGSSRDSSDVGGGSTVGSIADADHVGNCTICHDDRVHMTASAFIGVNPDPNGYSDVITHDCENCHGGGQFHHGTGPIPYPAPTLERCAVCHGDRLLDVPTSPHVVAAVPNCVGCHNNPLTPDVPGINEVALAFPTIGFTLGNCVNCHNNTLTPAELAEKPFANEIVTSFASSRHAVQGARTAFCSACHSHEGGIEFLAMGRKVTRVDLAASYTADTADAYLLPAATTTVAGVNKKTCATCHEPHNAGLRGDGDVVMTGLLGGGGATIAQTRTVYSAQFNLCTACHMVDLTATWVPEETEVSPNKGMFVYELSDKYLAANLIDATTGTFDFANKAAFYHDGASGNGRTLVDTHFGGTIMEQLVMFNGSATDITVKGYNINPGNSDACTVCHDPHTAGKLLAAPYTDDFNNEAISYAEGLGDFHTNYLGVVSYRDTGCTPCHSGDEAFASVTSGKALTALGDPGWNVLGCRGCHDLAQPNAVAGTNNSAAFAQVRQFPAGYQFKFSSAATPTILAAELGDNQVCFECHKGRTAGLDAAALAALADPAVGTLNYAISYLHYAPSMAILYGDSSKMVATYAGKTYSGRFLHYDATPFGCVDCHDVHNTEGNHAYENKMLNPAYSCSGCHDNPGQPLDVVTLQTRTQAFSERLLDTVMAAMIAANGQVGLNATCQAKITALMGTYPNASFATANEELMDYIQQRQVYFPNKTIAQAATNWKVFTYEDGAPHGQTHGHGGSWAHNSRFARQVMFDAVESLGGSVLGLTRP